MVYKDWVSGSVLISSRGSNSIPLGQLKNERSKKDAVKSGMAKERNILRNGKGKRVIK